MKTTISVTVDSDVLRAFDRKCKKIEKKRSIRISELMRRDTERESI